MGRRGFSPALSEPSFLVRCVACITDVCSCLTSTTLQALSRLSPARTGRDNGEVLFLGQYQIPVIGFSAQHVRRCVLMSDEHDTASVLLIEPFMNRPGEHRERCFLASCALHEQAGLHAGGVSLLA